jgi:hypothetical protein
LIFLNEGFLRELEVLSFLSFKICNPDGFLFRGGGISRAQRTGPKKKKKKKKRELIACQWLGQSGRAAAGCACTAAALRC